MLGWRRIRFTLGISTVVGLWLSIPSLPPWHHWKPGLLSALTCTSILGLGAMLMFGVFEQWPRRLSPWLERWVLQVVAVAVSVPISAALIYWLSTAPSAPPFYQVVQRRHGFLILSILGVLIAPWAALGALVRQKEALAREQAL